MARITVEDCLENCDNRFELVMAATERARQLNSGASDAKLDWENDKATVVALREIAAGLIDPKNVAKELKVTEEDLDQELSAAFNNIVEEPTNPL